jgi:hypothetical protein
MVGVIGVMTRVLGIGEETDLNIAFKMLQVRIIKDIPSLVLDWKCIDFIGNRLIELLLYLEFEIINFLLSRIDRLFVGDFAT